MQPLDASSVRPPETSRASAAKRHALRWILAVTLVWLGLAPAASAQGFGANREIFTDLTGSSLQNLTNNSNYPDHPSLSELVTNYFEGPYNYGDHYGDRYRALLIPPLTGTYVFWVQGQNAAALSLSIDESPFDRTQIAVSPLTSFYRQYYAYPSQQSVSITLQAGRRYYIEGIHSSGNGNDSFSAGWKLPNGIVEQPIPGTRLIPFGAPAVSRPSLTSQPANLTLAENSPASFRVGVSNLDAVIYQWQRNGANIPGVLGATYTLPSALTNDTGASFRCVVSNSFGAITSATAVLTVTPDASKPVLASVASLNFNTVQVIFNEPVEPLTATNVLNYSLNNGVSIASATPGGSPREIILATSALTSGSNYTVTVSSVRDLAVARNVILANSQQGFTALFKGVYREVFTGIPGSLLIDLTNNAAYPSSPSSAQLITNLFETADYGDNNYGQRLRARLLPPVTGSYTFWVSAHDTATLFLGTNAQPASAKAIASVSSASLVCGREWLIQTNQQSVSISLVGGQQYYIEAQSKGGLSLQYPPDHLAVRWQLPDGSIEEPIPVARLIPFGMNPPSVVVGPANTNVLEGAPATFAVTVSNPDPIFCQWQQNGTNVPGATNGVFTLAAAKASDQGATFRCILSNPLGTTNTSTATLTIIPDTTRPALTGVANNSSNRVVVYFTEPVDPATSTNATNYAISGITISASVLAADARSVTLTTTPLTFGSNYTITVNRVRDRAAVYNVIATNSQWTFGVADFFVQDIGGPPPGALTYVNNGFNLQGGNADVSSTNDSFNFAYQQRRGDFDVKVRVARLDFADTWTTASLMAREDLSVNSRYAAVFSTPSVAGTFFQSRDAIGALPVSSGAFPVNYPYTWLRIQRIGGTKFNGYASLDGQVWTQLGSLTLSLPPTIYLGFTVSSRKSSQTVTAQFRDFQDNTNTLVGPPATSLEPPGPCSRRTPLAFTEIMYHPAPRADGRKTEFIEVYNSNPFFEDISGYRISGEINYTFPPGTVLSGGGFVVVARNPADLIAVSGVTNVVGPYSGTFSNKKGTVRLRNRSDAILLEVGYDSSPPWPSSADGGGHSIVLARPSYGEGDGKAWAQSDTIGGSPGGMDGVGGEPARSVMINEFLAHTDLPDLDYIELYNHGNTPVNLSGYWLTDDPATNKFRIPNGTIIGPTGYVFFTETSLGFSLSASGETLYFVNSNQTRIVDSVQYDGQENGVAAGRVPDGGPGFYRLAVRSPGSSNGPIRLPSLIINEIMYNPISGDDNDEFLEIYNRGTNAVNLTNWRIAGGIDYTFRTNLILATNAYLVVAKNVGRLLTNYATLNTNNTVGPYTGTLGNGGDHVSLEMADTIITTNLVGVVKTNLFHIPVNELTYGTGGRWGKWSDGGGSSLELIDPHSDNRLPSNWTDSDDTAKSTYTTVTATGLMDNNPEGSGKFDSLQVTMMDEGECLLDSVSVTIPLRYNSANLVTNSGFESSMTGWVPQGAFRTSFIDSTLAPAAGSRSLHIVAKERGDTGANRIYTILTAGYDIGDTGTISAQVKWLHGCREMLLRLRGNLLEAPGILNVPKNLGTPGARNSRYAPNAGPAITEIAHSPVLPAPNQDVIVTARVSDPDGLLSVQLVYRVDPIGSSSTLNMVDNGTGGDAVAGDGVYSATIPSAVSMGVANDSMVAFYLQTTDRFTPAATSRFPSDAPVRECLVHFGESQPLGSYGSYRLWITAQTLNSWLQHEKYSNEPYDGTVVYNNFRIIYNAASHFAGSPAHTKLYDSPIGTNCDYQIVVPSDDLLLAENSLRIQQPGLFGSDDTGQNEQIAFWMVGQFDVPTLHRRSVNMFVNGFHRGLIYEDTQRPSGSFDAEWYPDSDVGDLYKVAYWYEYSDDTTTHGNTSPTLLPMTTTGGVKKLARYRQNFPKRAVKDSAHNFTNLFQLVDMLNTSATGDDYAQQVFPNLDVREWCLSFAAERIVNNTDLYGAKRLKGDVTKAGGQNAFLLKPAGDTWKFLCWDLDAAFLGTPVDPLFDFTDPPISNMFLHPFVLRTYWQALEDAANGPLEPTRLNALAQARYQAYQASSIPVASPDGVLSFLSIRRDYILQLISEVRANFAITSNGGLDFTNGTTLATISGIAPIQARRITVNGVDYPLTWSSITNWTVRLALTSQTNRFAFQSYDVNGNLVSNYSRTITVYFTGPISRPEDSLVINEIMFQPAVSNAAYLELYNRSTTTTFDLWNYRLNGLSFHFHPGDIIAPQSYIMLVQDMVTFQSLYGTNMFIAGEFDGSFDRNGESLSLIKEALTTNETDVVVDKVKYEIVPPWSPTPGRTNSGFALQLIDSGQDNARVSNWDDGTGWRFVSFTGQPSSTAPTLYLYLDAFTNEVFIDDLRVVHGNTPAFGPNLAINGNFESPLATGWTFLGTSGANLSVVTNLYSKSGTNCLRLVFNAVGSTAKCLSQAFSLSTSSNYTVSFWYKPTTNALTLTVRLGGSSFIVNQNVRPVTATPGSANWVIGTVNPYPLLWLNEVQPNNPNGLQDNTGTSQPWLELFNSGTNALSLDGYTLGKAYNNLAQWSFPNGIVLLPGEFRTIFVDGRPQFTTGNVLHASFRLDTTNGAIALSKNGQLLDYINYTNMLPGVSRGSYPDGQLFDRQLFYFVTPGASNNPSPVPVSINEWLASNTHTGTDPATGTFEDWFELYNFGLVDVNLSGFYLTDDSVDPKKWRVPDGTILPSHSFLLIWADGDLTGTNLAGNALHTSFKLSKTGAEIALYSPDSIKVDKVSFGNQTSDVSQGKYPDGNVSGPNFFMTTTTPRTNNLTTNNLYAPLLTAIPNFTINEGALLTFANHVIDNDIPAQTPAYSLVGTVPDGAGVDPVTGVFTWIPSELQGGDTYSITVQVTDNGGPPLFDTKTFLVTVNEANSPPVINSLPNLLVDPGTLVNFTIVATDPDFPSQNLTYGLVSGPSGVVVAAGGQFTWSPSGAQASSTNLILVRATDDGLPSLSATQNFVIVVKAGAPCGGYKADVTGTNGTVDTGFVTISDWSLIGRFYAFPDTVIPSNACQFAKADCSPKPCGDGLIKLGDWVLAGRYAAGLPTDPPVAMGGCPPPGGGFVPAGRHFLPASTTRTVSLTNTAVEQLGDTKWVQVLVDSEGDENGFGFTLLYDTNRLTYAGARVGPEMTDVALFIPNANTKGRLGIAVGLNTDVNLSAGQIVLVEVGFRALAVTNPVTTYLRFGDSPIARDVSDVFGNSMGATFLDGTPVITKGSNFLFEAIQLPGPSAVQLRLIGEAGVAWNLEVSTDLQAWQPLVTVTNTTGIVEYMDTASHPPQRFYRAVKP